MPDTEHAVSRHGPMVYRMAYAMTHCRHDADDIYQEVFLRYHRSAPVFEAEEHERAWLLKVTANCAKTLFLSPWRRRIVPLEDVYTYETPEETAVEEAMARLSVKYRGVVHLHYFEGYSTEEIGQILGRKPSTVRAQLTRARQKLAELLKEEI